MAMCTMAMVMFTGTTGNAVNVYAAADVTDSTIYAESDGVTDSTIYTCLLYTSDAADEL